MSRIVVGIDLGTTNSLIAVLRENRIEVIPDGEGRTLLPSVVSLSRSGVQVGYPARAQLNDPETVVVYSAKRLMGQGYEEVKGELSYLSYPVENVRELPMVPDRFRNRHLSPPEIGALVLSDLKKRAELYLNEPVRDAVVTVPAYFNDAQ